MLVTAENTWNDVLGPLNQKKPPKYRRFSHQSPTVGFPIGNHSFNVHGRTLHCGPRRPVNFEVMVFED